jgi:hypothetical protein
VQRRKCHGGDLPHDDRGGDYAVPLFPQTARKPHSCGGI